VYDLAVLREELIGFDAPAISISRAEAPIVRSNSKNPVVLSLLPVNCQLIRGLR
jgi:hypothetical protein